MVDPKYPFVAMDAYFNMADSEYGLPAPVVKVHEYPADHGDSIELQDMRKWLTLPTVYITQDGTQEPVPVILSVYELKAIIKQAKQISEDRNWNVNFTE